MTRLMAFLSLMLAFVTSTAWAQPYPVNEAGVTMGHWHLNSRDVEANKKILVAMGGTATKFGPFDIVRFPGVVVFLNGRASAPPPTGGTVGTVVDHVGFMVPNVQAAIAQWKAAGVPVESGGPGRLDRAFVTTPDGLRIEILEDKTQTIPIRHHQIHFYVPESEIPKIQAWYGKFFGAKPGMRGTNVAGIIPGADLLFSKTDKPLAPTTGHVLDHIGFDVNNLEAFCKNLEAEGIKLDRPYTKANIGGALAFIHDPWGTSIELNEWPHPL